MANELTSVADELFAEIPHTADFIPRDDEQLIDGIPYCNACHTPRGFIQDGYRFRCLCKCQVAEDKRKREEEKKRERRNRIAALKLTAVGGHYANCMFADAKITPQNKAIYDKAKRYVANFEAVKDRGVGVYLSGDNSSGKTHLAATIVNELIEAGYVAAITNMTTIISARIANKSYSEIANVSMLVLDDFGKEFLGREFNQGSAKYAEKITLEFLSYCEAQGLPIIVTSNYTIGALAKTLLLDKAILERLNALCVARWELNGCNFRAEIKNAQEEAAKTIGI